MASSVLNPQVSPSRPSASHADLKPPRQGQWGGPVGLALVVHALLIVALTWGVSWKRDAPPAVFEAELWSRLPQAVAPRAAPPQPPPATAPKPVSRPTPRPEPVVAPPPVPDTAQSDIATDRAKKQAEETKRAALLRQEAARRLAADQAVAQKAAADKAAADKLALEKKRQAEKLLAEKAAEQKKAVEQKAEKAKEAQEAQAAQDRLEAAAAEKVRLENIRRMLGQAGATGGPQASGTAQKASGPSPGYGSRVAARIKPNVVFTDEISGNPVAEIEVRTQADGSITSRRLVKSSGNPAWDQAALRAIDRTGSLPLDNDGRVPSPLTIEMRPQN